METNTFTQEEYEIFFNLFPKFQEKIMEIAKINGYAGDGSIKIDAQWALSNSHLFEYSHIYWISEHEQDDDEFPLEYFTKNKDEIENDIILKMKQKD